MEEEFRIAVFSVFLRCCQAIVPSHCTNQWHLGQQKQDQKIKILGSKDGTPRSAGFKVLYLDSDGFSCFLARRPFAVFWGESEGHH